MPVFIIIFGALTFLAGIVIVMNPELIFGFLQKQLGKVELHILNVVVRVFFGGLLINRVFASIQERIAVILFLLIRTSDSGHEN